MKYDCPKCQRNLKGEDLWLKGRPEEEPRFACPGCGQRLRTKFHAAEALGVLFTILILGAVVAIWHYIYGLSIVIALTILSFGVPTVLQLGSWLHRNKQRYEPVEHAV